MYHLGMAYHEGKGVRQSDSLALKWLMQANQADDFPAARTLINLIAGNKRD